LKSRQRLDWLSLIAGLAVGGLSYVAWLSTARRLQRRRVTREESAAERTGAQRAVRHAHDELEGRVEQRTAELADSSKALQTETTERERAEEVLLESEEKFRELAENITDVFWIHSPDLQQLHYISPAYELIWGRSMASWYSHPEQWADAILPEDRERVRAVFLKLVDEPSVSVE
jgi:PAS domain-containing protein